MTRFNDWLAIKVTAKVGTMWCVYAFCALALISLPAAIATGDKIVIIAWIAQTFLQLVLLPLLMVGQGLLADAHEDLHDSHDALHDKVDAILNHHGITNPEASACT